MKTTFKQAAILALAASLACRAFAATPAPPAAKIPIVPGLGIGGIKLGGNAYGGADSLDRKLGKPDFEDDAMGGKSWQAWYLGAKRGDKGRPFHRPDEIGVFSSRDITQDTAGHTSYAAIKEVATTSPRYATAEGIGPSSTLDEIRAKFPDIQPDDVSEMNVWPFYGEMQFFKDVKHGIAFAIRKSDGVCIETAVMPPQGNSRKEYFVGEYPIATQDYTVDDINGTLGDIKLGMTGAKLLTLLGKPDEKRDVSTMAGGALWRWRVPGQRGMELPALCIYLRKLPDGTLVADQIRVSSRAFALTDKIFPGCTLQDALQATGSIAKLDSYKEEHTDIYGDLRAGILFDVRQSDSVCTAITIFPPQLDIHRDMGKRWLDLPPPPNRDD